MRLNQEGKTSARENASAELCLQDADNGTQVPDLGPKFYIARPLLKKQRGTTQRKYVGYTFTPLHCDLADAVNYSCWGSSATWHIFHRRDRPSKSPDHILEPFLERQRPRTFCTLIRQGRNLHGSGLNSLWLDLHPVLSTNSGETDDNSKWRVPSRQSTAPLDFLPAFQVFMMYDTGLSETQ